MKKIRILLSLLSATLLLPTVVQAQMSLGTVKAFTVKGDVTLIGPSGKTQPLQRGMEFTEGSTVKTGENSSALLLFSNGSAVTVSQLSEMKVTDFEQVDFDPQLGSYLRLTEDPSQSKTKIYLDDGKLAGQVKRLQVGSTYEVNTPTGSAGIRGTDWVATVTTDPATGEVNTVFTNSSGDIVVSPGNVLAQNAVPVAPGQSVRITATRTVNADGTVTFNITDFSEPETASDAEVAAAQEAVAEIQQAEVEIQNEGVPPTPVEPTPDQGETPTDPINPDINISPAGGRG